MLFEMSLISGVMFGFEIVWKDESDKDDVTCLVFDLLIVRLWVCFL
jgi:hypothetical protein